jgi:hypothetical protein
MCLRHMKDVFKLKHTTRRTYSAMTNISNVHT